MPLSGAAITSSRTVAASSRRCPCLVAPNTVAAQNVNAKKALYFRMKSLRFLLLRYSNYSPSIVQCRGHLVFDRKNGAWWLLRPRRGRGFPRSREDSRATDQG